jgi:penicillin-binding protein 1B
MRKLFYILALLALLCVIAFFYVDQKVTAVLSSRNGEGLAAIMSEPLRVSVDTLQSRENIIKKLSTRRYILSSSPKTPGEYAISGNLLKIITREFTQADGTVQPSANVEINLETGHIQNSLDAAGQVFMLEPVIITPLGSGEVRASSYMQLSAIPANLKQAVLAIEDQRFYHHFGIDPVGIARAMFENLKAGQMVQGGSTLTQQLAKNVVFSPERSLRRKVLEAFAALSLEWHLTKDQIFERYLNEVYLGQEGPVALHGVAEAATSYFGKKVQDLSLAEAATLAGIIRAPSYYSPRRHLQRALERRNIVISTMREQGMISAGQEQLALLSRMNIQSSGQYKRIAPHYVATLSSELDSHFNFQAAVLEGLKVYTGLDPDIQECAEQALEVGLAKLESGYPQLRRRDKELEAGLVALEPHSGKIRAWVGGREYTKNQFDHVFQAKRQIGSTIKPFLYLTALDSNLNTYKTATVTSILSDRPMQVNLVTKNTWEPENYDHEFRGDVTLRYALENSLNLPAVYVAEKVGLTNFSHTLRAFHVAKDVQDVPALALGAAETSLLELTAAFGALANGGIYVQPRPFIFATNADSEVLAKADIVEERAADEAPVYVLTNILQGVVERGTAKGIRRAGYSAVAAGKTGTSNETRDAWFVGYDPTLVAGVWVGYDDNSKVGLTGGVAAVPIWTEFMKCAAPYHQSLEFVQPPGVIFVDIDSESGDLASAGCPRSSVVREVYVRGTEPRHLCSRHGSEYQEEVPEYAPQEEPKRRKRGFWEGLFG